METRTREYPSLGEEIAEMLVSYKKIAIVGLSQKPDRPSHAVASYLKSRGYKIYPVNPSAKTILEEKSYPDLKSIPDKVDIVTVFRRSEFLTQIAKDAVEIKAKVLWMQEGIINEEAQEIAQKAGLKVIMDRCISRDHRKLLAE